MSMCECTAISCVFLVLSLVPSVLRGKHTCARARTRTARTRVHVRAYTRTHTHAHRRRQAHTRVQTPAHSTRAHAQAPVQTPLPAAQENMSMSSSTILGLAAGLRASSASCSFCCVRASATDEPSAARHENITTCAVKLSPLPLLSAVRTMEAAASAGLPQCCNARSTACWSLSTSHTPSHASTTNRSSSCSLCADTSGTFERIGLSALSLRSGSPSEREHER
mmetsp:Transcript_10604/g.22540  ORF Transcript_10604/g.22540 Transcript_10604/m.22540 type:complete len:223 (+) Transcript_10604:658-1326(+)